MRRSMLLVLIAALALAIAAPATASSAAGAAPAEAAAKAKAKKGKKKAAKCKTAKKKAKGKAKARKSLAAAESAAKKGKKKAKRKCAKPKPKPKTSPRKRSRNPVAERIAEKMRERREQMEERRRNAPKAPTLQDVAPADGTYTSPSAPGLTVTVSGSSTQARVTYTLPMAAFTSAICQTKDLPIDVSGALSLSQSTGKAHLMANVSAPNGDSSSATGYLGKDGSFQLGVNGSYEHPPGAGSFCSANAQLTGTLVKQ